MKTLLELYGDAELGVNPDITDIMFRNAFAGTVAELEATASTMKKESDLLLDPFFEAWKIRLATEISNALDDKKTPDEIVNTIPWLNSTEYRTLLGNIDSYVGGQSESTFAMKIVDLLTIMQMMKDVALNILNTQLQPKPSLIETPFSNEAPASKIIMP